MKQIFALATILLASLMANVEKVKIGDLAIQSTVEYDGSTYSVTSIGNCAFEGCSGLTSVTIPNSAVCSRASIL